MGIEALGGRAAGRWGKEIAVRAKKLFPEPRKNVYKLAKKGNAHGKLYSDNVGKPTKELEKTVRSLQKRIDGHERKIAYPITGAPDWDTWPPKRKNDKLWHWYQEIKAFTETRDICRDILKDRKK
mgnify:CR=1 FL=1